MECYGELGKLADDGERAQCHVCGKWFLNLGMHVVKAHAMTCLEYRERFDLKRTTSLAGTLFKETQRDGQSERLLNLSLDPSGIEKRRVALTGDASPLKRADVRAAISRQSRKPYVRNAVAEGQRKPSSRAKRSALMLGRKPSNETRAKLSAKRREMNLALGESHWSKRPENREKARKNLNSPEAMAKKRKTWDAKKARKQQMEVEP